MRRDNRKGKEEKGFTLIETMVSIVVFAMISLALFSMFSSILQSVRRNKAFLAANSIIVENVEVIRGMNFEDVTTQEGFENGNLLNSETVVRGGTKFTILRDITWVDDPYDGTGTSSPADLFTFDYKKVRIRVQWRDPASGSIQESVAITNVVPEGLEGLEKGKGGVYLTVFDADGKGVPQAVVDMRSENAKYSLTGAKTDSNGNLWISNLAPASDYRVKATKAGYSMERTYAVNDKSNTPPCDQALLTCNPYNPNPVKRDLRVVNQQVTRAGFAIDMLGSLNIKTIHFSSMSNWRANVTREGEQSDPSAVMLPGEDPNFPYLLVAFESTRMGNDIYLQRLKYKTTPDGFDRNWPSDKRTVAKPNAGRPTLKKSPVNGAVYLTWHDESAGAGDSDIYIAKIDSATGAMIGSPYRVNHSAAGTRQTNASMEFDQEGNIFIAWEDNRNGTWDIYMQKFLPSSSTFFQATDVQVNSQSSDEQLSPKVVTDNANNAYVAWQSNHSGDFDVYIRKLDKNAVPGIEKKVNTDSSGLGQYQPDMAYDGADHLYVAWADERNSAPDIYLQKLDKDLTSAFAGGDMLINDDTYASASRTKPSIAYFSDSAIYVTWEDTRNGMPYYTIYTSKVNSDGARQWPYDFMAADSYQSIQTNPFTLVDSKGYAITLWEDNREEPGDILAAPPLPPADPLLTDEIFGSRYNNMDNIVRAGVPVTVTSTKHIGTTMTDAEIAKYDRTFVSDAAGNIDIDNASGGLEWGEYVFSVDTSSGFCLESTNPPFPLAIYPDRQSFIIVDVCP